MKIYCQFLTLSTGYIEGSCPPKFEDSNRKPIDSLGSDGRMILDGRKSINTLIEDCELLMAKQVKNRIGFKIIKSNSFRDKGVELYNSI